MTSENSYEYTQLHCFLYKRTFYFATIFHSQFLRLFGHVLCQQVVDHMSIVKKIQKTFKHRWNVNTMFENIFRIDNIVKYQSNRVANINIDNHRYAQ